MKHLIILILLTPILIFSQETGTFTDTRDGHVYKTVKIGDQIWMAENLKYDIPKSMDGANDPNRIIRHDIETNQTYVLTHMSYEEDDSYVPTYGYLYNWKASCESCPAGWHLPQYDEWMELADFLGNYLNATTEMKEQGSVHWNESNKRKPATNSSGFTALPAGVANSKMEFSGLGTYTSFWTPNPQSSASSRLAAVGIRGKKKSLSVYFNYESNFKSVRCIKD